MAKGNDGNYLQHSIEIESAERLTETDPQGRLHIALTHGMAPWERLREPIPGQSRCRLCAGLTAATLPPKPREPPVVAAYRKTRASTSRYPNSAELLRTVVGTDKLSGGIAEVDNAKYRELVDAWSGSRVFPVCESWRCHVSSDRRLAAPRDLQTPWLFSMDPMTYIENGDEDDCYLHRADMDRLSGVLSGFIASGMPGIATLFVYAVRPETRPLFWNFVDDIASRIGAHTRSYWVPHQGGNRNLAGLLYAGIRLSPDSQPQGIRVGRT